MTKRRIYRKLQIGTAECTGNVHGINRVLNCRFKVLLCQEMHLTLADARLQVETDEDNVAGKKKGLQKL